MSMLATQVVGGLCFFAVMCIRHRGLYDTALAKHHGGEIFEFGVEASEAAGS
jgi:hypothetical protein